MLALTTLFPDIRRAITRPNSAFRVLRQHLMNVLRRANPRVDLGRIEIRPSTHLATVAVLAVYFPIVMPRSDGLVLALLRYGLVPGALIAGRGAGAAAAVLSGQTIEAVRLAPVLSIRVAESGTVVRRAGVAGIFGLAGYGAVLIGIGSWHGSVWPPFAGEMVALVGWWCALTSIAELLPLKPAVGHERHPLWARTWPPRPRWLVYLAALALWSFGIVLVSLQFPSGDMRQQLDFLVSTPAGLETLVFIYFGALLTTARHTTAAAQHMENADLH